MKTILIIEDEAALHECYQFFLRDYKLIFALTRSEIERALPLVDLVVSDYSFSPSLSHEQVREMIGNRVPIILVSGQDDKVEQFSPSVHKIESSKKLKPLIDSLISDRDDGTQGKSGT